MEIPGLVRSGPRAATQDASFEESQSVVNSLPSNQESNSEGFFCRDGTCIARTYPRADSIVNNTACETRSRVLWREQAVAWILLGKGHD